MTLDMHTSYLFLSLQDLQYGSDGLLGLARTWPQAAGVLPQEDDSFDWEGDRPLNLPMQDLVVYEMHVRGFTQDASSRVHAPGVLRMKLPCSWLSLGVAHFVAMCRFHSWQKTTVARWQADCIRSAMARLAFGPPAVMPARGSCIRLCQALQL